MKNQINNLKQRLLKGWTLLRLVRLALALIITVEAWISSETLFAILGSFLAFQAIFNYGCCGAAGCNIDDTKTKHKSLNKEIETTTFIEVK